ncbi:hypothetical protein [Mycolicibacterium hodleri]|uniref:hypothetical protein n=1 Tax=Mycolicibacterium hodleri TaxID=49897 RepID=UPI00112C597A|nr:hypothetical protein [Mycolicibacterium hodleri]
MLHYLNRVSGALLLLVGAYVAYYGWYELRLFSGSGDAPDPIVTAAGRVQSALAGWVYRQGAWPWLVGVIVLAFGAAAWSWRRRIRLRRVPPTTSDVTTAERFL